MIVRVKEKRRTKIGLALSGGGMRGVAHIGALKAIIQKGVKIDFIAGTSAGAIAAALYASGYMPEQLEKMAGQLKFDEMVDLQLTIGDLFKNSLQKMFGKSDAKFWSAMPKGLIKGDKLEKYFSLLWSDRNFNKTEIPLAITAVDLLSTKMVFFVPENAKVCRLSNARYYSEATIADAVRASIAVPGVFYPKDIADMQLVDGGVKNNLPTDILREMGAELVIGVDLGCTDEKCRPLYSVGEIILRSIDMMSREVTQLKGEKCADIIIRPRITNEMVRNSRGIREAIKRGELAAKQCLEQLPSNIWGSLAGI